MHIIFSALVESKIASKKLWQKTRDFRHFFDVFMFTAIENGAYPPLASNKEPLGNPDNPLLGTTSQLTNPMESTMTNKNELIAEIADKTDLTKAKAAEAVDAFIEVISKALSKGKEVRLVGFGTFTSVKRKATEGRNPRTGAVIKIAASIQPKFKAGKALKDTVNKRKAA